MVMLGFADNVRENCNQLGLTLPDANNLPIEQLGVLGGHW